jgi:hypothetical protein
MTDTITDATNTVGGLIGLGIVAGIASNVINGPRRRYAAPRPRRKSKITPIKTRRRKKAVKNKFLY